MEKLSLYSQRMSNIPESFIREILKVAANGDFISFAGGLPNPEFFPVEQLAAAADKVISKDGKSIFQYNVTEGYMPLREMLAELETRKTGEQVKPEQILITNGSQQGLDLAGKIFLNAGDEVLMEAPTYLGAIQAFSAYQPKFKAVPLLENGIDLEALESVLWANNPKIFYCIPDHQNPSGISYSDSKKELLENIFSDKKTLIIEDSAYRELSFDGSSSRALRAHLPDNTLQLNSFSKIISPGLRIGWAVAPVDIIKKLTITKQASDLHTSIFSQRVLFQYLLDNDLELHLKKIRSFYESQCQLMINFINAYLPEYVNYIRPRGGMFIWLTLPEKLDSELILAEAMKEKVVFVPGKNFYLNAEQGKNCMRLNFSGATADEMERGIRILGNIVAKML